MDVSQRLDALLTPLREDVISGASAVACAAADILCQAADSVHADSPAALRSALAHTGIRILEAQPAMAPLVALLSRVLEAVSASAPLSEARAAAHRAAHDFAAALEPRADAVAERVAALIPEGASVLTLSSSKTVLRALESAPGLARVVVLESRPVREGRETARALAAGGVPVLFAVDAAVATLVRACTLVLLGADSIGDAGCVNKLGSLGLAMAARHAGVPVVVAADSSKILPFGYPQHLADDRPPAQVWQAPAGVDVWNRYFEAVPIDLLTHVVTEGAVLAPEELTGIREGIVVPDEIRAWVADRAGEGPDSPLG